MGLLGWIVVGLLAGGLARWIVKDERTGCIYTMVVGVLGAIIGGGLMSFVDEEGVEEFSLRSILVAALGRGAAAPGAPGDRRSQPRSRRTR